MCTRRCVFMNCLREIDLSFVNSYYTAGITLTLLGTEGPHIYLWKFTTLNNIK